MKKNKLSFYLIIVLREDNQVQFELLTKIFELFNAVSGHEIWGYW